MIPTYSGKTPYTASPDSTTTISPTAGYRAYLVTVSVQACWLTLDGSTPSATNGLTLPVGGPYFLPVRHDLTLKSATAGSIVNAVALY